jgi:hypothetical protein
MSRRITIEFLGKDKNLGRTVDQVDGKMSKIGGRLKSFGKVAAAGLAAGAVVGGKALFDMGQKAGDLNETISKTNAIFGTGAAKNLEKWAKGAATSLGQSQQTALDAASVFGTFGKAAGKTGMDLASFAKQNTQLATDLASFHNTSPEEAIEALGAAFRGEAEPMRKFGVLLDDASMRQQALKMGLVKTTKEALTPQQKVLAAQALIMKQTGDAQGDFARTSGGLANQQRILKAQFENVQASIGQKVLPVLLKVATWINTTGLPALKRFGGWLGDTLPPIFEKVRAVINKVLGGMRGDFGGNFKTIRSIVANATSVIRALWDRFGKHILTVIKAVFKVLQAVVKGGLRIVSGIFKVFSGVLRGDWKKVWSGIRDILKGAWTIIRAVVKHGWDVIKSLFRAAGGVLRDVMRGAWNGIKDIVRSGVSAVVDVIRGVPGRIRALAGAFGAAGRALIGALVDGLKNAGGVISGIAGNVWSAVRSMLNGAISRINAALSFTIKLPGPDLTINPPDIPFLAKGGVVKARPGGTLAVIGEGGHDELVMPLSGPHAPKTVRGQAAEEHITVVLQLDGREIHRSLVKRKRTLGTNLGLA